MIKYFVKDEILEEDNGYYFWPLILHSYYAKKKLLPVFFSSSTKEFCSLLEIKFSSIFYSYSLRMIAKQIFNTQ